MKEYIFVIIMGILLLPLTLLNSQITLPIDGKFETEDSVSKYKNFKYHNPKLLGGYNTRDSVFGKYLYFSGSYRNYRNLDALHTDSLLTGQTRILMLCNANRVISTNEIPVDKNENFSKRAGAKFHMRNRRQLLDPSSFIFYGIVESHEKGYQDQLYYKYNGIWILIMPGPLPWGHIEISDNGEVSLVDTYKKIFFKYRLIFRNNCYYWVRQSPNSVVYNRLRDEYLKKNKNSTVSR